MPVIDLDVDSSQEFQRPNHHLSMLVPREIGWRADDAVVEVATIMEDSSTAGSSTDKRDIKIIFLLWMSMKEVEVGFEPWALVAADDNAWSVGVEEQDCRFWRRLLQ